MYRTWRLAAAALALASENHVSIDPAWPSAKYHCRRATGVALPVWPA